MENLMNDKIVYFIAKIFVVLVPILFIKADFEGKLIIGLIICILLILFIPEVRLLIFGLAGIASFFAMIASIIHFQIFGALLFFILSIILFWIASIAN